MSTLPSVVRPCVEQAAARAAALVERAVAHAAAELGQEQRRLAGRFEQPLAA